MQPDMIQPNNYRIDEAKYKSLLKYTAECYRKI